MTAGNFRGDSDARREKWGTGVGSGKVLADQRSRIGIEPVKRATMKKTAEDRDRTDDLPLTKRLLYQLSYLGGFDARRGSSRAVGIQIIQLA